MLACRDTVWGGSLSLGLKFLFSPTCLVNQLTLDPDGKDPNVIQLVAKDGFSAVDGFGLSGVYDVWRPIRKALQKAGYVEGYSMVSTSTLHVLSDSFSILSSECIILIRTDFVPAMDDERRIYFSQHDGSCLAHLHALSLHRR